MPTFIMADFRRQLAGESEHIASGIAAAIFQELFATDQCRRAALPKSGEKGMIV
jgi:hypothetical protein